MSGDQAIQVRENFVTTQLKNGRRGGSEYNFKVLCLGLEEGDFSFYAALVDQSPNF